MFKLFVATKERMKKMSTFFEDLKKGLEEAVEYQKGRKTLRSKTVEIPSSAKIYKAKKINK